MHDYHHSHNVGNYGAFNPFWDWLMGTDASWRNYMKKKNQNIDLPGAPSESDNHTPLNFSFWKNKIK